jgi:hypothetical protein
MATSKFDDIVNGVDGVIEFLDNEEESSQEHIALSFDVVFSSDEQRVIHKLNRTKKEIENGKLTEVKYFEDSKGNKKRFWPQELSWDLD